MDPFEFGILPDEHPQGGVEPSDFSPSRYHIKPISEDKFRGILRARKFRFTLKKYVHECPLHKEGPVWEAALVVVTTRLAELELKKQQGGQFTGEEERALPELKRLSVVYNKKVSEYQLHLKQYEVCRDQIDAVKKTLKVWEVLVYRDFVNQYMLSSGADDNQLKNLVLVMLWREQPDQRILFSTQLPPLFH